MPERNIVANRVQATLDGKELPRPLSIQGLGNVARYKQHDETSEIGGFVVYKPGTVMMEFPITDNKTLREIGGDEEKMKKDYKMTIRFLAADNKKPLTTTDMINVRFRSITQEIASGVAQPVERAVLVAERLTHS